MSALLVLAGCQRGSESASADSDQTAVHPTVASLVPSATDILVEIGAGDHLVAVSTYDNTDRPELAGLPRVGDYQSVDWEQITALKPDIMIVFQAPDRMPAGLKQRADALGIKLVNSRPETLADLYKETSALGNLVKESSKAEKAIDRLSTQLRDVTMRIVNDKPVRTLIITNDGGTGVAGQGTFLNDLLGIAGGSNVITTPGWTEIDEERLAALRPDAVIVLLPGVSVQVEQRARQIWAARTSLPAVADGRVYFINQWYALQPGFHVGALAHEMAQYLHPSAAQNGDADSAPSNQKTAQDTR